MRSTAALLCALALSACATTTCPPEKPPTPVAVHDAVPVPCEEPDPTCSAPAYDAAKKDDPADVKVKLLRAESIAREDCVRLYREALGRCRTPPSKKTPPPGG